MEAKGAFLFFIKCTKKEKYKRNRMGEMPSSLSLEFFAPWIQFCHHLPKVVACQGSGGWQTFLHCLYDTFKIQKQLIAIFYQLLNRFVDPSSDWTRWEESQCTKFSHWCELASPV